MPLAEFIWDHAPKPVQDWMDRRGLTPDSRYEPFKEDIRPWHAALPETEQQPSRLHEHIERRIAEGQEERDATDKQRRQDRQAER